MWSCFLEKQKEAQDSKHEYKGCGHGKSRRNLRGNRPEGI